MSIDRNHTLGTPHSGCSQLPERLDHDPVNRLFEFFTPRETGRGIFHRLGYSLVGPLCVAFASYIGHDMQRRGIRKVFFGARDGYLVKEAFEMLGFDAESRYLRLSRRALYVPAFAFHRTHDNFFDNCVTASEFFERLNLPVPGRLLCLDPSRNRQLFEAELKATNFLEKAKAEADILLDYLAHNDFSGKVAFVDIGWRGSSHDSLQAILGSRCEIHGYHFGTIVGGKDKHGFYFMDCLPLKRFARVFRAVPVIEFLFTEPVTSISRIKKNADGFDFEFLDDESESQIRAREEIASGCRSFFADFSATPGKNRLNDRLLIKQVDQLLDDFIGSPDEATIDAFENITHSGAFGGIKNKAIVSGDKFSIAGYRNSYWRAAYVAKQKGMHGHLARAIHAIAESRPSLFIIYKSFRIRQFIDRLTN